MFRITHIAALGALLSAGCADPATAKRIDDLEKKVAELEQKAENAPAAAPAAAAKPATPATPAGSPEDQAAMNLYREASEASQKGDNDTAKAKIDELKQKYPTARVISAADRLLEQLSIVGKPVDKLDVDTWIQGDTTLANGKATLLVFWEVWCPHCKREVPKLEETYTKWHGKGLNMVGVTKMSRGKTEDDVKSFLSENKITYPIAKEGGAMSALFGVSGVPAAAVVKDGKIVWRGHPAQLNDEMISGWL
ncbi:MAG: TlpA family protein disulfide reductase [Alphaproteobacteria bacterium]|nr:TlpA family protein disulfide reductase [Alphaproteobacteria bacterium]